MAKYLIHSCEQRHWYVNEYLVPSMVQQGISKEDIEIFNDTDHLGNLKAFMLTMLYVPKDDYGIWHLQDDVVISKFFKERTEQYDDGLVCGFCSSYSLGKAVGIVNPIDMWYSFPCIRIPNVIAHKFANWFYHKAKYERKYERFISENKYDDELFRLFMQEKLPELRLRNVSPNLVEHIDWLLGGSTLNSRKDKARSLYWNEEDVVKTLESKLQQANKR